MAHLMKPWVVHWIGPDGKRCKKDTPGATRRRGRSQKWYAAGPPGQGSRRVPLHIKDKKAAQRELNNLVLQSERGEAALPASGARSQKLADLVLEFSQELRLGMVSRSRQKKKPAEVQVHLVVQRVQDILGGCRFALVSDLNKRAPVKLAEYLEGRVGKPRKDDAISHQTAAFMLAGSCGG